MAAYTFVADGTTSTSGAPGQPAGKAAGNLLLLTATARLNSETIETGPAGWTLLADCSATSRPPLVLFGRIATNDANDDVSHDFFSGSSNNKSQIACYSGDVYTDLNTIVHTSIAEGSTGSVANIPLGALTISLNDCLIISVGSKQKTATSDGMTFTKPAWMDNVNQENVSAGSTVCMPWGYAQQTTATNIDGAAEWTQSIAESLSYSSLVVALKSTASGHPAASRYRGIPGINTLGSRFGRGW